jgi:type IV pilus assembly protein PilQ
MIRQARETIRNIDRVTPQVLIEARVVEATSKFSREIGTQWNVAGGPVYTREVGNGLIPEGALNYNISATNPPTQSKGIIGFNFSKLTGTPFEILNAQLLAAESNGDVSIISSPSILTLDNKTAKIKQGTQVPVAKLDDSGNTVIEYRDVDLELEVTPHVTADNRIAMEIKITNNELGALIEGNLSFTTKEANTELLVNDGDTIVIGGIRKSKKESGESGVPGLMQVPFLSWLFKTQKRSDELEELLIFITPKIIILKQRE